MKKKTLADLDIFNIVQWQLNNYGQLRTVRVIGDVLHTWCKQTGSYCTCSFSENSISVWMEDDNEEYSLSLTELLQTFPKPTALRWDSRASHTTWTGRDIIVTTFIWSDGKENFTLDLYDTTCGVQ